MRKMIFVLLVVGLLGLWTVESVDAADTATITVTVTCRSLGVTVSPTTWAIPGVVELNSINLSTAFTVTNTGNAQQDFRLNAANSADWTIGATPGSNIFRMSAIFKDTAPLATDFIANDDLTTAAVTATAAIFCIDADLPAVKGYDVLAAATRNLWLRFQAPTATTATVSQSITVTITAIAG